MAEIVLPGSRSWIEDDWDGRDHPFTSTTKLLYPVSTNLREGENKLYWLLAIYNQGALSSCVANATIAAYYFKLNKELAARKLDRGIFPPSRLFIYWIARNAPKSDDPIADTGCMVRNAMKRLWKQGVCNEATWSYDEQDVNDDPGAAAYQEAEGHCIVKYEKLDIQRRPEEEDQISDDQKDEDGNHVLDQLRQCLLDNHPVVFGFSYYCKQPAWTKVEPEGLLKLPALTTPKHSDPPNDKDVNPFGGHSIVAVGYEDERQLMRCLNSWGDGFSVHSEFWMPYQWITDFEATDDFWMLRLVQA